ncbi:hypothetical protein [Marivirga sp.]|uniref:hypothetical protein n=1 Tax=Marivirga sp. TaxID=2018662 RepID=UPI002D7E327C|nr:hypothetical protein [Marivirga sp.]HET8859930.1 hypothetical protein [Marivirga sp.]
MEFKDQLEEKYNEYLADVARDLDLSIYEKYNTINHGALIKLENSQIRLQLTNDRGLISLEVSSAHAEEDFYDLELIFALLNPEKSLVGLKRKQILNNRVNLENQVLFLQAKYQEIASLFSDSKYRITKQRLSKLGEERFFG